MSAAKTERLAAIAQQALAAGRGEKGAIYAAACAELGISLPTLHRQLKRVAVTPARKRRADAGETALTLAEAKWLSTYLLEHFRKNGKCIKYLEQAVNELRANGQIVAGRVDTDTGELIPLSTSAIRRALWGYGLHPEQLLQPAPVTPLKSDAPNEVWQMDASLCVIYKLPVRHGARIVEIKEEEYYKNKLSNLARIEHLLVQRYVVTDHASGAVYVHFGLGGESARGLVEALVAAMLERTGYPFYGAPQLIMVDQASANKSAQFRNLCKSLGIRIHYTKPGNPRSKGQVEQAQNLTECSLESGLKMAPEIRTVETLNALAQQWLHWFNGTRMHSRHGMTRYAAWQLIGQVRRVGARREALLALAREEPIWRKVTPYMTVEFKGKEWDVQDVPGLMVKQKVLVCRNAWDEDCAMVVLAGEDGREVFHAVPEKRREGPFGFYADAARIIEGEYKRVADTPAQTAKKELERLAMGAETLDAAEAARAANVVPFGGAIDPYKEVKEYQPPAYLPSRGVDVAVAAPTVEYPPVPLIQAAQALKREMGDEWTPEHYAWLAGRYPGGVPADRMEALMELVAELRAGLRPAVVERPRLRAV
jgi:hypothetical protein